MILECNIPFDYVIQIGNCTFLPKEHLVIIILQKAWQV